MYNHGEDSVTGFHNDFQRGQHNVLCTGQSNHPPSDAFRGSNGAFDSPRRTDQLINKRSYAHHGTGGLSRFSNSVAVRGNAHSQLDCSTDSRGNQRWNNDSIRKSDWSQHSVTGPISSLKKTDQQQSGKQSTEVMNYFNGRDYTTNGKT